MHSICYNKKQDTHLGTRWAQLQILTWELRHDYFIIFFSFFPPCSGTVCPLWKSFKWLTWTWKTFEILLGVLGYLTNKRNCNAGMFFLTQKSIFLFLFSPRRSHRQLYKEDGEKEWWPINTGCPSTLSWEKAAKSTRFKWPNERNGVILVAQLPLWGKAVWCSCSGYVCIMQND